MSKQPKPQENSLLPEIKLVDWYYSEKALSAIRTAVFIEEQHVPPELEWDGLDHAALHLLAPILTEKRLVVPEYCQAA